MGNQCCTNTSNQHVGDLPQFGRPSKITNKYDHTHQKQISPEQLFCIEGQKGKEALHSTICAIKIFPKKGCEKFGYGSGILISKNIVLTAAHIIYDRDQSQQCEKKSFQIFVGINGIAQKYYEVESWWYPSQFKNCPNKDRLEHDYALIKLKHLVDCDKFVPLALPCPCLLENRKDLRLKIFGYPQYRNYQPQDEAGVRLKLNQYGLMKQNRVIEATPDNFVLVYKISTLSGQSGCPIVVCDRVIALHIGAAQNTESNIGRLFTLGLLQNLSKWCKELKGSPFLKSKNTSCRLCSPDQAKDVKIAEQASEEVNKHSKMNIKKQISKHYKVFDRLNEGQMLLQAAKKLIKQQNYMQGKQILQSIINDTENLFGEKCLESTSFRVQMAIAQIGMSNIERGLSILDQILEIHQKKNAIDHVYAETLQVKGRTLYLSYHLKDALTCFEQSLRVCKDLKNVLPFLLVKEYAQWLARCLKELNQMQKLQKIIDIYGLELKDLQYNK